VNDGKLIIYLESIWRKIS